MVSGIVFKEKEENSIAGQFVMVRRERENIRKTNLIYEFFGILSLSSFVLIP